VVPNPDERRKYALLDGSDIFCVPSRFEGWCIAAIEAQSRGLPVVATRTDGTEDSIREGETGILVENNEHGSVGALARSLEDLCRDMPRRLAMGASARSWASRFTWQAAAAATEGLLLEMVGNLEAN
jgi:glycosyltransferase involved in cell wall biosynthesis